MHSPTCVSPFAPVESSESEVIYVFTCINSKDESLCHTSDPPLSPGSQETQKVVGRHSTKYRALFRACSLRSAQRSCNKRQSLPPPNQPLAPSLQLLHNTQAKKYKKNLPSQSQLKGQTSICNICLFLSLTLQHACITSNGRDTRPNYPSMSFCFVFTSPCRLDNIPPPLSSHFTSTSTFHLTSYQK